MLLLNSLLTVLLATLDTAACSHIPRVHGRQILNARASALQYTTVTKTTVSTGTSYSSTNTAVDVTATGVTTIMPGVTMTFNRLPAYVYLETEIEVTYTTTMTTTTTVPINASGTPTSSSKSSTQTSAVPSSSSTSSRSSSSSSTNASNTSKVSNASSSSSVTKVSTPVSSPLTTATASPSKVSSSAYVATTYTSTPPTAIVATGWSSAQQAAIGKCFVQGVPATSATPGMISSSNLNITACYDSCKAISNCQASVYNAAQNVCLLLSTSITVNPSTTDNIWFAARDSDATNCYLTQMAGSVSYPSISATPAIATASPTGKSIPAKCSAQNIAAAPVQAQGWATALPNADYSYLYQDSIYGTPMASLQDCCTVCAELDSCIAFTYSNSALTNSNDHTNATSYAPSCQVFFPWVDGETENPTTCSTDAAKSGTLFQYAASGTNPPSAYGASNGDFSITGLGMCNNGVISHA